MRIFRMILIAGELLLVILLILGFLFKAVEC
ncbi:hypothetical protein Cp4447_02580 [Clostridium perfringens]|uniref:Uncharacterized protein n=1 Tax=Clostridium perfringens TaxID=1502 RepID=A0A2X2VER2_CLOPF|nr:hypothetical protein [Clostridium perfringens]MDH5062049.1 hypothetical protein [Clostridium perfringens NCTC 8239]MDG6880855.1 hypothetical protein [Clostridium perfringens]MDG6885335.1 hypothetical protein [Clostridium perfringens]MDG6887906.1 hypothetical protein [Clostridium perfringens]